MECPRCGGKLSRTPAISRTDDKTAICAACGTDESIEILKSGKVSTQKRWPRPALRPSR